MILDCRIFGGGCIKGLLAWFGMRPCVWLKDALLELCFFDPNCFRSFSP